MIHFIPLELSSVDVIVEMMEDFYAIDNYPINSDASKNLFKTFIENENLGRCWLIYDGENPIGYVILTFIFSFEYQGQIAFIDELYVRPTNRNQGIGQQTIAFIKIESKNLKIKLLYLEVENHNKAAQSLYLKNGFERHNRHLMKLSAI